MPSLSPENRSRLLSHLRADQSAHWRCGEWLRVEHYLEQYPELADDASALLDLIHSEMSLRLESGERPPLDEYLQRFPQHADALSRAWPQLGQGQPISENGVSNPTISEERTIPYVARPARPAPRLPGLELYEKLGEGAMGVVYRARDTRLEQPRAIKVIRAGPFAGDESRERFNREAKAVARLDHAGVVRIYSLGEHEENLYLCMEFLEGGNLHDRLRRGVLEFRETADLVRQLALAVQHAHENRVLHRDLKPSNVLLTVDGTPKVSDFGLAKLLDEDDGLTRPGSVMGTPAYMAPEQADGRLSAVGEGTDVYSLGAILYECLTGRPPFKGETRTETMEMLKTQPPPLPRRIRAGIPVELEAICLKCLEKRSEDRYSTAAKLADDLGDWLDGKPTSVRPARGLRRLTQTIRRRPRLVLLASLVLLTGMTAGFFGYFKHPDYPLWRTQAQLRAGKTVELIGATGKPSSSHWRRGEKNAKAELDADGIFTMQGWPLTLLELLPDTCGQSQYRIRAEIRHLKCGEHGAIGLYFAATTHRANNPSVISFLQVSFNDLEDLVDQRNRLPPPLQAKIPVPNGNRVQLMSRYHGGDGKETYLNLATVFAEPELFKPSGHSRKPGQWRTIRIDVSPDRVRVFWEGAFVGQFDPTEVVKLDRRGLDRYRRDNPENPALVGLAPLLNLQGGLGLYLNASYASFRNVRVEPLDGADDNP
jgi:serine/threonine protein kinase